MRLENCATKSGHNDNDYQTRKASNQDSSQWLSRLIGNRF
jgi:hypothetical protein